MNGQQDLYIHHLVKVSKNAFELGHDVTAQRGCDLQVMPANRQIHI